MESLLNQISLVKEGELGVKEFQLAVLTALLSLMKEQESLNSTLKNLTARERKEHLSDLEDLISDDSSDEEDKSLGNDFAMY